MQKPKDGRNYQTLPSALCPLPMARRHATTSTTTLNTDFVYLTQEFSGVIFLYSPVK